MYIQTGSVKLSVLSKTGKEAVVAMLGPGDFFGEGCLAGQKFRMGSATALTPSAILFVDKAKMIALLHRQHAMSDRFISHMLTRNIRIEEDLIVRPVQPAEKRLARRCCCWPVTASRISLCATPPISQTLAEMIAP
jgi:CRP-like cAMP-binding protein